ncbi:unnamed protein product [Urochloa humidicola]
MASLPAASGGGGEVSIRVPSAAAEAVRGVLRRRRSSAAAKQERRLNGFVRFVAFGEWAGNAFGTLAFLWATVVLLGGYCKDLKPVDFWCATAIIFIEAFRMFSRNYRLDDQSLFRTTRAIRAISSPFVRMLVRPQEWNELAAVMGSSVYLVGFVPSLPLEPLPNIIVAALLLLLSKLQFPGALRLMSRPRRFRRLLLWAVLASLLILAALLIRVLIPGAVTRIVLSSLGIGSLPDNNYDKTLLQSMMVFYVLTLCQGTLYIVACISDIFSFFLRRSLARQSGLRGKLGARVVDLYYHSAYIKCMETGILAAGKEISLASFAIESVSSSSRKEQLAGVLILDSLLQQREELVSRIACSSKVVSTLVGMLGWTHVQDGDIRLFAARVTAKLAFSLRVAATPGMLKLVSSLLDAEDQLAAGWSSAQEVGGNKSLVNARIKRKRHDSYVSRCLRRMKEKWTIPAERPLTHQDSFPVIGMLILERLASDHDNCAEICRATDLISKITGFISYTSSNGLQQKAMVYSSLSLVRRLAITGGKIGVLLRQELWEDPFLLHNLVGILEDSRSSIKVWEPAMDIIAKLALAEDARMEIGINKVIIGKLMHAFLGRYGLTNMHYCHELRLAAGEALANLAIENPVNCLVILEEPGYKLIKDLKDMLWHEKYRYVAATLLQNLCAHSRDKMHSLGANEHLSYALPVVMEKFMAVEGKQMETLIGLALQICNIIPECVVHSLESHLDVSAFVQKLVSVLHANKKQSPEYPRMRRMIIELIISIIESHPRYTTIFLEGGMMKALSKIESIPSKVERYRIFLGNAGVVLESGLPLPIIVARAKGLFDSASPSPGAHHWSPPIH